MTPTQPITQQPSFPPAVLPKPLLTKTQAVALSILATLVVGAVVFVITASLPAALIAGAITAVALAILIYCKYKSAALPKLPINLPQRADALSQPTVPVEPATTAIVPLTTQQQMVQLIDKAKSQCSAEDVTEWQRLIEGLGDKVLNPITEDQETVFHYLAKTGGPVQFVPLLCKQEGHQIFHSTTLADGYTPLHLAIVNGHYEMTMAILNKSGSIGIHKQAKNGMTALHLVVGKGMPNYDTCFPVVNMLMTSLGASPNVQDNNGNTPLHFAAVRHDAEITEVLKERLENVILNAQGQNLHDLVKLPFEEARAFLEKAVGPDFYWKLESEEAYDSQYTRTARYFGL